MNKDTKDLIKEGSSTFLNIAQMTHYRVRYVQTGNAEDKDKMYKHVFLAGVGIACLFMIGIFGMIESRRYQ